MAEPLKLQNPFSRIVAVRRGLVHGLAEVLYPDHIATVDDRPALNHFYPRGGNAFEQNKRLGPVADTLITKRPGLYSGEMRKVVQDNLARGLDIPYEFSFFLTHGIFTAADGSKHIVEISNSGIFTWPLRTRDLIAGASEDTHLATLDYIPLRTERPQNPTQIADASLLSEAYARSPWFQQCGWAFSPSGAKAANVTLEVLPAAPQYIFARLWEITITEATNAPSSASIADIEGGYVWSPIIVGKAILKIPDYGIGACVPVDLHTAAAAPASSFQSPIHCWYETEAVMVARYHYDAGSSPATSTPPTIDSCSSSFATGTWYLAGASGLSGIKNFFSSPILTDTATEQTSSTKIVRHGGGPTGFFILGNTDCPGVTTAYGELQVLYEAQTTGS